MYYQGPKYYQCKHIEKNVTKIMCKDVSYFSTPEIYIQESCDVCIQWQRGFLNWYFYFTLYITHFTVPVKTISLQPNNNPLSIIEGTTETVECVVNKDAAPPPVFTWYLKYNDKERIIERNTTFVNITGNRTDNSKTLECQSTNNIGTPPTASTLLNIQCKYM